MKLSVTFRLIRPIPGGFGDRQKNVKAEAVAAQEDGTTRGLLAGPVVARTVAHRQSHPAHIVVGAGIFWRHPRLDFAVGLASTNAEPSPGGSRSLGCPGTFAEAETSLQKPAREAVRGLPSGPTRDGWAGHGSKAVRGSTGVREGTGPDGGHGSREGTGSVRRSLCGRCCAGADRHYWFQCSVPLQSG